MPSLLSRFKELLPFSTTSDSRDDSNQPATSVGGLAGAQRAQYNALSQQQQDRIAQLSPGMSDANKLMHAQQLRQAYGFDPVSGQAIREPGLGDAVEGNYRPDEIARLERQRLKQLAGSHASQKERQLLAQRGLGLAGLGDLDRSQIKQKYGSHLTAKELARIKQQQQGPQYTVGTPYKSTDWMNDEYELNRVTQSLIKKGRERGRDVQLEQMPQQIQKAMLASGFTGFNRKGLNKREKQLLKRFQYEAARERASVRQ